MDTSHLDEESHDVIQLKTCPRCKKGIRKSLRYGNIIKQQLLDIEKVKAKVNGDQVEIEDAKKDLETSLRALKPTLESEDEERDWDILMKRVTKLSNMFMAAVTKNQVMLMKRFAEINQKLKHGLSIKTQSQVNDESRVEGTCASIFFLFSVWMKLPSVEIKINASVWGKWNPLLFTVKVPLTSRLTLHWHTDISPHPPSARYCYNILFCP